MLFTWGVGYQRRAHIANGERATCRDLLAVVMSVERGMGRSGRASLAYRRISAGDDPRRAGAFPAYFKA